MPATPTRFATLAPLPARLLLAMLALLVALGLVGLATPGTGARIVAAGDGDAALYRAITAETAARGATPAAYYAAAAHQQRTRGYPLRPFVTMREPALALVAARIGPVAFGRAYRVLALVALVLLVWRLGGTALRAERLGAALCSAVSVMVLAQPSLAVWHEAWAAMLIVVALALAGGRGWPIACATGLAAVLVRELAAPVLVALLFAAIAGRRRGEAIGWAVAIVLLAVALAIHAQHVAAVVTPADSASPGWARLGGWRFIVAMMRDGSALSLMPGWMVALAVPAALFGWGGHGGALADRVALALAALIVPFMAVGRPDNFYWGLTIAPLLPIGFAFAPRALRDLVRSARQARGAAAWNGAWTADASS